METVIDRKRLIGEVAARHGVRLEEDDPAFLLVTLAELTLRDAQADFLAAVRQSRIEHEESAVRIQEGIGKAIATAAVHTFRANGAANVTDEHLLKLHRIRPLVWLSWGLLIAGSLFWAGFVLGKIYR